MHMDILLFCQKILLVICDQLSLCSWTLNTVFNVPSKMRLWVNKFRLLYRRDQVP
uniref:Uncharacterized protein n=1 Tax=Rhizophora mucronata TaxID=61149 RepID=A0A2P2JG46_RHIMU